MVGYLNDIRLKVIAERLGGCLHTVAGRVAGYHEHSITYCCLYHKRGGIERVADVGTEALDSVHDLKLCIGKVEGLTDMNCSHLGSERACRCKNRGIS